MASEQSQVCETSGIHAGSAPLNIPTHHSLPSAPRQISNPKVPCLANPTTQPNSGHCAHHVFQQPPTHQLNCFPQWCCRGHPAQNGWRLQLTCPLQTLWNLRAQNETPAHGSYEGLRRMLGECQEGVRSHWQTCCFNHLHTKFGGRHTALWANVCSYMF